jgi:hypothetical protein
MKVIEAYTNPLVGRRVRIIGPGYYKGACCGQYGTIRACWNDVNIAVDVDLMTNPNSQKGYYYFKIFELELVEIETTKAATAAEKGESKMQKMSNYVNVAVVQFLKDDIAFRTFEYANYTPDLAVGDLCVVMSAHHGMGLAEVVEIKDRPTSDLYREIVAKVDTASFDERVAKRQQAAELKVKMQERAKQLQDIVLYQTLAKEDPEMAKMLRDYMSLSK